MSIAKEGAAKVSETLFEGRRLTNRILLVDDEPHIISA
jgi:hypothetical protein